MLVTNHSFEKYARSISASGAVIAVFYTKVFDKKLLDRYHVLDRTVQKCFVFFSSLNCSCSNRRLAFSTSK